MRSCLNQNSTDLDALEKVQGLPVFLDSLSSGDDIGGLLLLLILIQLLTRDDDACEELVEVGLRGGREECVGSVVVLGDTERRVLLLQPHELWSLCPLLVTHREDV